MLDKLKKILNEVEDIYLRKTASEISESDSLIDDLGLDSLGRVSLFHEINFELNREEGESKAAAWITVKDILNYMRE